MPKSNPKVRRVRAWAFVWSDDNRLGVGGVSDCLYDVFETRSAATREKKSAKVYHSGLRITPITITYTLPKPSKKKTK